MYDFHSYLYSLSQSPLAEAVIALYEASEGDARKYMKKVLIDSGLEDDMDDLYGDNWSEEAFNVIRDKFVHKGCDVYFTPGLARIAYGELDLDTDDENTQKVNQLRELVKFITMAHKGQFTRNLERIDIVQQGPQKGMKVKSKPMTLEQLAEMFSREQKEVTGKARQQAADELRGNEGNGYEIIELKDFETAHKFLPYCTADPWCYLEDETTFKSYEKDGNKLYLALAPGFERLKPGDPGYGKSMIGFDMGPVDEDGRSTMCVCNNRYNHAPNLEHEEGVGTGDEAYDEIQLSRILGFPVWERCPGYTASELMAMGKLSISVLKTLVPDKETFYELLRYNEARIQFLKKYKVISRKLEYGPADAMEFYTHSNGFASRPFFGVIPKSSDKPLWFLDYNVICNGLYSLRVGSSKFMLMKWDGTILTDEPLSGTYSTEMPLCVSKEIDGENKYNFIDESGRFISQTWFAKAQPFLTPGTAYANVENEEGKGNFINREGNLMLPTWADKIAKYYANGTVYISELPDGTCTILDGRFNPICNGVEVVEKNNDGIVIERDGKYNMVLPKFSRLLSEEWFDGMDAYPMTSAKSGTTCLYVYREGLGYNFIDLSDFEPLLDKWYADMKPMSHQLFIVRENGKLNIFFPGYNDFILPSWFDDRDTPEVDGYGKFSNLWLNGVKVRVDDGKVLIDEGN